MEAQLHRIHGHHSGDPLHPAVLEGSDVHDEDEHGGEKKSAITKVKAKVLKATIKHGHGHHDEKDDAQTVNESPAVRSGLVEPTDMGTPVLVEDLYATHSDIVDPPVRSFAQWEEEERHGAPPPLSTGTYGTDLSQVGHHGPGQDVNREQLRGGIGKSTGMEEDPSTPKPTPVVFPPNHQTKVTDPSKTGGKEAGITQVLRSFDKMGVYDEPYSKTSKSDQNEPKVYSGSHDPEPVENPPQDTVAGDPSSQNRSYTKKITSATSAIADKAAAAKDLIVSKLGYSSENKRETSTGSHKTSTKSSFPADYAQKVADTVTGTLAPVYEKVVGAGSSVVSKKQGSGHEDNARSAVTTRVPESKGVWVKEYLVDTFRPGDEDKVLSEVITHAFHRGKGNATQETCNEGEGRLLQDSGN